MAFKMLFYIVNRRSYYEKTIKDCDKKEKQLSLDYRSRITHPRNNYDPGPYSTHRGLMGGPIKWVNLYPSQSDKGDKLKLIILK